MAEGRAGQGARRAGLRGRSPRAERGARDRAGLSSEPRRPGERRLRIYPQAARRRMTQDAPIAAQIGRWGMI